MKRRLGSAILLIFVLLSLFVCASSATDDDMYEEVDDDDDMYEKVDVYEEVDVMPGSSTQLVCSSQHIDEDLAWRWRPTTHQVIGEWEDVEDVELSEHFVTGRLYDERGRMALKLQIGNFTRRFVGDYECRGNGGGSWKVYSSTSVKLTKVGYKRCAISSALNSLSCSIKWNWSRNLFEDNEWFCFLTRISKDETWDWLRLLPDVCASHDSFAEFSSFSQLSAAGGNESRCTVQLANPYKSHADICDYYFVVTFVTTISGRCYNTTEIVSPSFQIAPPKVHSVQVTAIYCEGVEEYGFRVTWKTAPTTEVPLLFEISIHSPIMPHNMTYEFDPGDHLSDVWSHDVCRLLPDTVFSVTIISHVQHNMDDGKEISNPVWSKTLGLNTRISDVTSPTHLPITNATRAANGEIHTQTALLHSHLFIMFVVVGVLLCLAVALSGHVWDKRRSRDDDAESLDRIVVTYQHVE